MTDEKAKKFDFAKWRSEGLLAIEDLKVRREELAEELATVEKNIREAEELLGVNPKNRAPAVAMPAKIRIRPLILQVLLSSIGKQLTVEEIVEQVQEMNSRVKTSAIEDACKRLVSVNKSVKTKTVQTDALGKDPSILYWFEGTVPSASSAPATE